jgi:hypothetical protein
LARKLPAHTARTRKIPQNWPRRCFSAKQKRKNWAFCKTAKFSLSLSLSVVLKVANGPMSSLPAHLNLTDACNAGEE